VGDVRVAYVDCFSGISGDMFLGALVDAGLPVEELRAALAALPVEGYQITAEPVTRQGLHGHAVRVTLDPLAPRPERHLSEVAAIIDASALAPALRARAIAAFRRLAEAEAQVHGIAVDAVHFHEVGAVDAIVDVVGAVWGIDRLGLERLYASSVPTGSGTVRTAHGLLPVPAPATLALLASAGTPLRPSPATTELVTPTGAALLTTLAEFTQPPLRIRRVGTGFGQKTLPWPNVVRLWVGDLDARSAEDGSADLETDTIVVIEANLDDESPEIAGAALDSLLAAGALDVFFTPIQMKKNRPAVKLTVLAPVERAAALSARVLRETSTLGVRTYPAERWKARRWQETVTTPWGPVRVKVKALGDRRRFAPEYDDCVALARQQGIPLAEIYEAARAAAREGQSSLPAATRDQKDDGAESVPI
jgi:uncharacterized protein (TIGR00299 family) protein